MSSLIYVSKKNDLITDFTNVHPCINRITHTHKHSLIFDTVEIPQCSRHALYFNYYKLLTKFITQGF